MSVFFLLLFYFFIIYFFELFNPLKNNSQLILGAFSGSDRAALLTFTHNGNEYAISSTVDGNGLVIFDLRLKDPLRQISNVYYLSFFSSKSQFYL